MKPFHEKINMLLINYFKNANTKIPEAYFITISPSLYINQVSKYLFWLIDSKNVEELCNRAKPKQIEAKGKEKHVLYKKKMTDQELVKQYNITLAWLKTLITETIRLFCEKATSHEIARIQEIFFGF